MCMLSPVKNHFLCFTRCIFSANKCQLLSISEKSEFFGPFLSVSVSFFPFLSISIPLCLYMSVTDPFVRFCQFLYNSVSFYLFLPVSVRFRMFLSVPPISVCLIFVSVLLSAHIQRFSVGHFSHRVAMSVCQFVRVRHCKTPSSRCCGDLWLKNLFIISAYDDKKIPHTGDKASLDRCGQQYRCHRRVDQEYPKTQFL